MNLTHTSDRFWTASNVVSMFRGVLTIPVAYAMAIDAHWVAFGLCWFAAFTDWLDGWVARRTGTVSEWGKVIDPVADKILVGTVVVMLLVKGLLPPWFVAAVVARDIVILIAAVVSRRYTLVILPSLMSGKLAVSAIAFTGVVAMVDWPLSRDIGIAVSCVLIVVSLWQYGKRLHGIIRQVQKETR